MIIVTAVVVGTLAAAPAEADSPPIIVGAVGDAAGLAKAIGAPLAYHGYGKSNGTVPSGVMINMKPVTTWGNVAKASSGSTTHNDIVRWARTIKSRPGRVMFAFHHEPEASTNTSFGTATDYKAAYRRVVDIFRAEGVTNVDYTWQMTSWAFATSTTDARYASKWYPGDSYVDNVGTDPYNWYDCGPGRGRWQQLKTVMDPSLAFARARGKKLVVAEFASQADPTRRAEWLRNARQYFVANRDTIRAVFYFQYHIRPDCYWKLTSTADLRAMREMAQDPNFRAW